jgi:paraquat-inducible protein B
MAEIKFDEIAGEITKVLKDALYIGVGFGVLTFQKLQVQRNELQKAIDEKVVDLGKERLEKVRGDVESQMKALEERLDTIEAKIDEALDELQGKLPEQAADVLGQARSAVKSARKQVLEMVRREEQPAA